MFDMIKWDRNMTKWDKIIFLAFLLLSSSPRETSGQKQVFFCYYYGWLHCCNKDLGGKLG